MDNNNFEKLPQFGEKIASKVQSENNEGTAPAAPVKTESNSPRPRGFNTNARTSSTPIKTNTFMNKPIQSRNQPVKAASFAEYSEKIANREQKATGSVMDSAPNELNIPIINMPASAPIALSVPNTNTPASAPKALSVPNTNTPASAPKALSVPNTNIPASAPKALSVPNTNTPASAPKALSVPNTNTPASAPKTLSVPNTNTPASAPKTLSAPSTNAPASTPRVPRTPRPPRTPRVPNTQNIPNAPKAKALQGEQAELKIQGEQKTLAKKNNQPLPNRKTPLKIISLGGLNEIGKNLTVFECANDIFLVDCGLAFPDSELLGVDIVLPDFTYLERNADKIRGVVITHGHEDHIGGLAYLLKKINIPVYATRLTIGLIEGKLKEHGLLGKVQLNVVVPKQTIKMGCMAVEFIRVNHSIPDAVGLAIHTPAGIVIHTGDFKIDYTPIEGGIIDLARFGELGTRGVLALMSDSTNSERKGYTQTERMVGDSFDKLFEKAEGKRIIIATFSSNIHRVQQIINSAARYGRKVAVFGRSMINVMTIAIELGYLIVPAGVIIDIDLMNKYPSEKIVLITTGSQGEPMSALTRMAMNDHKKVNITPLDFIIISATPIPGNEKTVTKVINELMKSGAEVIYEAMYEVHVSGHACQDEQKLILSLTKPKFFIPIHGEYKHLKKHAQTAQEMGIPAENIVIAEIGNVIETDGVEIKITGQVPSGRVFVDGLGVGDVGSIVLRDRKHLAQDGLIIVVATIESESGTVLAGPDIVSRGFVYVRESEELMGHAKKILTDTLQQCMDNDTREWNAIKTKLKDVLSDYIYMQTKRSPMILPVIMEI